MAEGNGKVAVPEKEKKGWKGGNVTFRVVVSTKRVVSGRY